MSGSGREARRFASQRPRLGSSKLPHSRSFLSRVGNQPRKRVNPRNVRSRRRSAESELRRCVIDGSGSVRKPRRAWRTIEDRRGPSKCVEERRRASKSVATLVFSDSKHRADGPPRRERCHFRTTADSLFYSSHSRVPDSFASWYVDEVWRGFLFSFQ